MKINTNKLDIGIYLVFLQNLSYFLYLYTRNYIFLALYFATILPLLALVEYKRKYIQYYVVGIVVLIIFMITSLFSREFPFWISWYNLLYIITSLLAAYFYINSGKGVGIAKLSFYLYSLFLFYFIVKFGSNGEAYNEILEGSSRNYLSAISIFLTINIYVQLIYRSKLLLIHPALINFILCVLLFGRSGIALSLVILLFVIYARSIKLFMASVFFLGVFALAYISNIILYLDSKTNFAIGLESERSIFRAEYLRGIFYNFDFLVGRKISECCSYIQSFGNPHNSFIMGHMRYGIFHTVFSILILVFVFLKRDFLILFLVLIIFSRYFLDQLGLFAFFDYVLFGLIFISILGRKKNIVGVSD